MPATLDALRARIADDPVFAHRMLFESRHPNASAPFHKEMIALYHSSHERVCVLAFRGGAKSTLAEEALIIGAITGAFQYAVIVCATLGRAIDRLKSVKHELVTNDFIEEIFGPQEGDTWQVERIILANGVCIDALGAGQSTRGLKYLSRRPEFSLVDDLEESNLNLDNVSTPEKRQSVADWFFGVFEPSLSRPAPGSPPPKIRVAGTMLHEESLIGKMSRSPDYKSLIVPVEHFDRDGGRVASWQAQFPLEWIDATKDRYERQGAVETFNQEYMCQASSPQTHAFKEEHLRFDDTPRTWEPCHVIYDPARTATPGKSCATGKIVASWLANRLHVWEATQNFWLPDEIIADVFESNAEWNPISIGIEETGLNQFLMQPLRAEQIKRGSIPLRPLNPPRGPGKEQFLLRLQPFFAAGEVIFHGPRHKFDALVKELLGFPYGLKDTLNALAYMLEIKSGEPVCSHFTSAHVIGEARVPQWAPHTLLLHSDGRDTVAVLVAYHREVWTIIADFHEAAPPAHCVPSIVRSARATAAGQVAAQAPEEHFKTYDTVGLYHAASTAGLTITQGGSVVRGREEMRRMMQITIGQDPSFQVARQASWTLRALSGGFAIPAGKTEAEAGP
jgi:hypothetical protein